MSSALSECQNSEIPTCSLELAGNVIPSIQFKCKDGQPAVQSVMVHATDPESGITAPFKLVPGGGCADICHYQLGSSGLRVQDIEIGKSFVRIGLERFDPDPGLCG